MWSVNKSKDNQAPLVNKTTGLFIRLNNGCCNFCVQTGHFWGFFSFATNSTYLVWLFCYLTTRKIQIILVLIVLNSLYVHFYIWSTNIDTYWIAIDKETCLKAKQTNLLLRKSQWRSFKLCQTVIKSNVKH